MRFPTMTTESSQEVHSRGRTAGVRGPAWAFRYRVPFINVRLMILFIFAFAGVAGRAPGDVVHTSDGSRLVGTIQHLGSGRLVIDTKIAGRIELDATMITAIAIDSELTVEFDTGDRLIGTIAVADDQASSVMRTALGDIAIEPARIAMIWAVGEDSPRIIALRADFERQRVALIPKWSFSLEAGGTASEGNTDTLEAHGRIDVKRVTETDLLNFYLAAKYYEQNDLRSTNEYRGGFRYETSVTDRWYWYARMELEFDEFEDLDLRATVAAGAGRYWMKQPDHEFKTSLGLGYRHESYNSGRVNDDAVLDFGLNYRRDLAPWVHFTHALTYSPAFQDIDDYRLDLDTALLFPFSDPRFKLKLGVTNEYNSRPQSGFDRLDTTYYASLVVELRDPPQ